MSRLENQTFMLFKLVFADNIILSSLFFILLIIDICFLVPEFIAKTFNSAAELAMPIVVETHPVIAEAKISKCLL